MFFIKYLRELAAYCAQPTREVSSPIIDNRGSAQLGGNSIAIYIESQTASGLVNLPV